ncbi:hypothetical protein B0T14DRAFT_295125 [Immersiella caudata]|uniref:Uncharacterized protein n=1 Tax=Immersiella caudata TaxID=314043 RepID=A0AA39WEV0_9PEZI|nr:hypothetical protein B0T14DRAFT_295125 [Immersiella caudata]
MFAALVQPARALRDRRSSKSPPIRNSAAPTDDRVVFSPVLRVRLWTDEPFIGDVQAQNPAARAFFRSRSRRQPMHGAPPLSQGRPWGCSQHARCACTCTAGRCGVFACVRTAAKVCGCGCKVGGTLLRCYCCCCSSSLLYGSWSADSLPCRYRLNRRRYGSLCVPTTNKEGRRGYADDFNSASTFFWVDVLASDGKERQSMAS